MASSAQGNTPKGLYSEALRFDAGLTFEEAERFASAFRPSWELEETAPTSLAVEPRELEMIGSPSSSPLAFGAAAPGVSYPFQTGQGQAAHAGQPALPPGLGHPMAPPASAPASFGPGARAASVENAHAYAAAHAPAGRVETHEPSASVIIDRALSPNDAEARASGAPSVQPPHPAHLAAPPSPPPRAMPITEIPRVHRPPPAPAFVPSASSLSKTMPPSRPVARYVATDSAEYPVKKSNKPLFIGIGSAVALAALVLGIRAATSSSDAPGSLPLSTGAATHDEPSIPPPPAASPIPAPAEPSPSKAAPSFGSSGNAAGAAGGGGSGSALAAPVAAPRPAAPPPRPAAIAAPPRAPGVATPPPRPRPQPAPAPKSPPKPASGGIVRDVPF